MLPQGALATDSHWRPCCACSHAHSSQLHQRTSGSAVSAASKLTWQPSLAHRQLRSKLRFDPLHLARCSSAAAAQSDDFGTKRGGSGGGSGGGDNSAGASADGRTATPSSMSSSEAGEIIDSEALPEPFCLIESRDSVKNFSTMQLSELEDNIVARRNRIFLLMEEVRRLRIQRRLKGEGQEGPDWVPEEKFASAIPWLPPITEDTIADYWRFYLVTVAIIIVFGGLLSPVLKVRLGVGGQSYNEFIASMHLPGQLAAVDPIVASFCGGAVGVLTTLMVVEANNADQQAKRRCFYCQGSGYLTCGACVGTGSGEDGGGCNLCSGTGKVMCTACLCTGKQMATEHDPRIDPFD